MNSLQLTTGYRENNHLRSPELVRCLGNKRGSPQGFAAKEGNYSLLRFDQAALLTPRRFSRLLSKPLPFWWLTCAQLGQRFVHLNLRTVNPCENAETAAENL